MGTGTGRTAATGIIAPIGVACIGIGRTAITGTTVLPGVAGIGTGHTATTVIGAGPTRAATAIGIGVTGTAGKRNAPVIMTHLPLLAPGSLRSYLDAFVPLGTFASSVLRVPSRGLDKAGIDVVVFLYVEGQPTAEVHTHVRREWDSAVAE